ncbi:two-component system response regulator YesN [Neobacillus niacini]|uniref:response regulator transcription factor n=1 Tax=Neobacillus driksii TaxID=3035913 RepID=UPI00278A52E6|nr:response regulator [Neobacillus niacini]MDQ0970295.1 two-component system response regulator YesN [Neobacillus niacini]
MRVLIADDESLVRSSLISMLEELNLSLELIGETKNGEETIQMVKATTPDIVFVDISMPKGNGLDVIRRAKPFSPDTQWIILTGYSNFEYAKEAIKLGATNYINKPVSPEELAESLDGLLQQYQQRNLTLNNQFESELISHYNRLPCSNEKNCLLVNKQFYGSFLLIDSYLPETFLAEQLKDISQQLRKNTNESQGNQSRRALMLLSNGELASVWGCSEEKETKRAQLYTQFEGNRELIQQVNGRAFAITIFQSDLCSSIESLFQQYKQLQELSPLRAVANVNRCLSIKELSSWGSNPYLPELSKLLIDLAESYRNHEFLSYMKILDSIGTIFKEIPNSMFTRIKANIAHFLHFSIGHQLNIADDLKYWMEDLCKHSEQMLEVKSKAHVSPTDLITQVVSYIDQHFMSDIGLNQIANQLNVTPNYLSTLFRKRLGITFMKYLTRTRMLKAKELLSNPGIQVQQVSERVGYFSTRHFTKLFYDYYGCYPSDYRDRLRVD